MNNFDDELNKVLGGYERDLFEYGTHRGKQTQEFISEFKSRCIDKNVVKRVIDSRGLLEEYDPDIKKEILDELGLSEGRGR